MITPDILPILRCPMGGGALVLANRIWSSGQQSDFARQGEDQLGTRVEFPIDAGMVNSALRRLTPFAMKSRR